MRKSILALPLVAAGFIFACGGTDRQGFATFTQPTDPADAAAEGGSGASGFNVNEGDNLDGNDDGGCSTSSTTITRTPVVLEFVVDESGSMEQEGKWTAQRDALLAAFEDMKKTADPAFFVGVQLFDTAPTTKVKPKPLTDPDHYDDLVTLIDKPSPHGGSTGSEDALTAGYHVVDTFKPPASAGLDSTNIKRVVVFMSDGAPSGQDTEKQACESLADDEYTQQPPAGPVYTFAIGVGHFPSDNPSNYDPAFMGYLAQKGGTAPAGCDPQSTDLASTCHFQVTPGDDTAATKDAFLAAITKIRALSASCEFKFSVTAGSDLSKLKVTMTGADGKVTTIKRDATNGWTFDDDKNPTKVILHGNACSASNGTVSGRVDVTAPCSGSK